MSCAASQETRGIRRVSEKRHMRTVEFPKKSNKFFSQTIELLRNFDEVDAITLGGSKAFGWGDSASDFDVYVYLNSDLCAEKRRTAFSQTCKQIALDKRHWGAHWDYCVLNDGVPIEFTYMRLNDTQQSLENTLLKHIPWGGYTTCTCYMVFNAKVLYDPKGLYGDMVEQFTMPYPEQLRKNIVNTNRELLHGITPSYFNQIEKAIHRKDFVSVNHRLAAFVQSYFDILFAINRVFQPGEKHLIELCKKLCEWLSTDFETDLQSLFSANGNDETLPILRKILSNLDELITAYL